MSAHVLVTGALGCIGAAVVKGLLDRGHRVLGLDLGEDRWRLIQTLGPAGAAAVPLVQGDVSDTGLVRRTVLQNGITHVIHLAALQIPTCRANPVLGARVNVLGTVNVFEAAREAGVQGVAYASSVAAHAPPGDPDGRPATHYGVYKRANEGNARVYWLDHGLRSVGLRPATVYGPGRDVGVTSDVTLAIEHAARGEAFTMRFSGPNLLIYTDDVAAAFIQAAFAAPAGAPAFDLGGNRIDQAEVAAAIERVTGVRPRVEGPALPVGMSGDDAAFQQACGPLAYLPFEEGVRRTVAALRR